MPLDGNKLREIEFHLEVLDERLARMEHRGTHRSDDAGWAEHKHPRGPDGKFTSGSGAGKTKSIAKDYMSKLANAGKTIPVQGFIKHLINSGVPVKNIIEATKEEFGEAASASQIHSIYNKKMLPNDPNLKLNHDHWDEPYHGEPEAAEKKAGGLPEIPAGLDSEDKQDAKQIQDVADGSDTDLSGWDHPQQAIETFAKTCSPAVKEYAEKVLAAMGPAPSSPAPSAPAAEPAQAPAASPAQAKGQLSPETKSIYQKNIDDWQHSMQNGDDELKAKFDEVMDAQLESDPAKKQEMIEALKPMSGGFPNHDSMNEFIAGIKADAGAGASKGKSASSEQPTLSGYPAKPAGLTEQQQKQVGYIDKLAAGGETVGGFKPDNLVGYLNSQHAMADDGPVKEYLGKVIAHLNGHPAVPEPERVLPPKPGDLPDMYDGASDIDKHTGKTLKEIAEGKHTGGDMQAAKDKLQNFISNSNEGHAKDYAGQLLDHLNDNSDAPASGAMPEPPASLGTGNIIKKIALGQFPSSSQSPAEQLQLLIDGSSSSQEEKAYAQKLLDHLNAKEAAAPAPAAPVSPHANGVQPPSFDVGSLSWGDKYNINCAEAYASGKQMPHYSGGTVDQIKKNLSTATDPQAKKYTQSLLDGIDDGSIPLPQFKVDPVPSGFGKLNLKAAQTAYDYATASHLSGTQKLDLLQGALNSSPKDAKDYINSVIKTVKTNKANAEYVPPNAGPVAPGHKLSAETHKELAENAQHWDKVGPSLKPAVDEKHNELKAALAHPTAAAQKNAIAALKPIENPSGMGQKSMNAFIAKVQNEYGVAPQPATTAPTASPTPAQQAKAQTNVAAALKKAPHKVIKHINELEDHTGAMVQAKHVAETSKILGDHYQKVTAAYGNSQDAMAPAVDKAMTDYWKDIDKTWDQDLRDAIYSYQNGNSGVINKYFRKGPDAVSESVKTKVAKMQKALESSFVPADTPAWRGLGCEFEELTGFADPSDSVGRCFEHKNFASISRSKQTSLDFGSNVLMKMTIPAGTPGLVVGGQTYGDGGKHHEKEIILGPYSMWRIDKYEKGAQGANHLIHVTYLGERTDGKHDMTTKDS